MLEWPIRQLKAALGSTDKNIENSMDRDFAIRGYIQSYDADPKRDGIQLSLESLVPKCTGECDEYQLDLMDPAYAISQYNSADRQTLFGQITDYEGKSRLEIFDELKALLQNRLESSWSRNVEGDYDEQTRNDGKVVWCNKTKPSGPCKEDLTGPFGPYSEKFESPDGKPMWCAKHIYCLTRKQLDDYLQMRRERVERVKGVIDDIDAFVKKLKPQAPPPEKPKN